MNNRAATRTCVMVLGMHRSGTSALTRVISLLGAELPKTLLLPAADNVGGFWESKPLVEAHDRLLADADSGWMDWRALALSDLPQDVLAYHQAAIRDALLSEFGETPCFVLKDPRVSRFVPFYLALFAQMGIRPIFVHANRNPKSVAGSLATRERFDERFSDLLWLRHELDAEFATRGQQRVFVSYEGLLADWRTVVSRIVDCLGLDWAKSADEIGQEVDAYLQPSENHNAMSDSVLARDQSVISWVKDAYLSLKNLENSPSDKISLFRLDEIREDFNEGSANFGGAMFGSRFERTTNVVKPETKSVLLPDVADMPAPSEALFAPPNAPEARQNNSRCRNLLPHFRRVLEICQIQGWDNRDQPLAMDREAFERFIRSLLPFFDFDEEWYLATYPDVKEALAEKRFQSAWEHFLGFGYFEGRLPGMKGFDPKRYVESYADLNHLGNSPDLVRVATDHYLSWGYREGRVF